MGNKKSEGLEKTKEYYFNLLPQKIVSANLELDYKFTDLLKKEDLKELLHNSQNYNTGIFEGNLEKGDVQYLYLSFARNLNGEIHFLFYRLAEMEGEIDTKEILSFASYCADQLKMSKDKYLGICDVYYKKLETLGYLSISKGNIIEN